MGLSAQLIRKFEFPTKWLSFGAYDKGAVDDFLESIAMEVEESQAKLREVQSAVSRLSEDLERYRRIEDALQEALNVARENARRAEAQSAEKAQKTQAEAAFKAHQQITDAEANAAQIVAEAFVERDRLKNDIRSLEQRREDLIAEMQSFLEHERVQLAMLIEGNKVDFSHIKGDSLPPLPHQLEASTDNNAQVVAVNLEEDTTLNVLENDLVASQATRTDVDTLDEESINSTDEVEQPTENDELSDLVNQLLETDKSAVPTVSTQVPEPTVGITKAKKSAKRETAYKNEIDKIQQILSELQ